MAKIHRSAGQRIFPLTSARNKNKSLWDQLELLIIPGVLIAGAFFTHDQLDQIQQNSTVAGSAEPEAISIQPLNNSAQSSINQDLLESEQANEAPVLTQTSAEIGLSWLDRSIRGQLLISLKRADLVNSNREATSFNEVNSSSETNLLVNSDEEIASFNEINSSSGTNLLVKIDSNSEPDRLVIKFNKTVPTNPDLAGDLLKNLFSTTDQKFPRVLFIGNDTKVSLSGVDLFGNNLTTADLFETKLIKADFRGASFSKAGLVDIGFPGISLFETKPLATELLNINLARTKFLSAEFPSVHQSGANLIEIDLGSNLGKIDLIEADFWAAAINNIGSNKENLSKTNPSSDDLNKPEPRIGNLGATDFSEPSQIQANPSEAGLDENISETNDRLLNDQ